MLSASQKKQLKRLAAGEISTAQIGKDGFSENTIKHILNMIDQKELIRIKIRNEELNAKNVANKLHDEHNFEILRVIGGVIIAYKESESLPREKRIRF